MSTHLTESTREKILTLLQANGPSNIVELAEGLGITHISIRHHLSSLLRDRLVEAREERHGVGRPRMLYRLTNTALDRNTGKYLKLTNLLLRQLKEQLPPQVVEQILMDIASHMADELRVQIQGISLEERIERLIKLLIPEGFLARVEPVGSDRYRLTEFLCPYATISVQHPELCILDATILSDALGATVERQTCILSGSESCTFTISEKTAVENV